MKYKNFKSAIHNFTHSFMSIDYLKSGRLAINVLINLNKLKLNTKATFDFINKTISPKEAVTNESEELFNDYLNWLPNHFEKHDCEYTKLEKLEVTIFTDFDNIKAPHKMKNCKELVIQTMTKWKADGREEQIFEISQNEVINENFIKFKIPEFK